MTISVIKITIAVLLFLCLAKLPYGYYQFVRFISLVGFSILAYYAHEKGRNVETIIFICLAILFQPLLKIALGRELWNIVDVGVGIGLLISVVFLSKKKY